MKSHFLTFDCFKIVCQYDTAMLFYLFIITGSRDACDFNYLLRVRRRETASVMVLGVRCTLLCKKDYIHTVGKMGSADSPSPLVGFSIKNIQE
jgi:hypothetical protein